MMSAPVPRTWSMYMAFTVPPVPTGMKAGVRTVPRGMTISPRRAMPSVASRRNPKLSGIIFLVAAKASSMLISSSKEQARIAIGVEAITFLDRVSIGRAHRFQPRKSGDEHEQRRARQMEIGHQRVGDPEA